MAGYFTLADTSNHPFQHVQNNDLIIYGKEGVSNIVFGIYNSQNLTEPALIINRAGIVVNYDIWMTSNMTVSHRVGASNIFSSNTTTCNLTCSNADFGYAVMSTSKIVSAIITTLVTSNNISSNAVANQIISSNILCSNITCQQLTSQYITSSDFLSSNITAKKINSLEISAPLLTTSNITTINLTVNNATIDYSDGLKVTSGGFTSNLVSIPPVCTSGYLFFSSNDKVTKPMDINYNNIVGVVPWAVSVESNLVMNDTLTNVGIGFASPMAKLAVNGNIIATEEISTFSDERLKCDIVPVPDSIQKIKGLTGYTYKLKQGYDMKRHMGLIAQEVNKVAPEVVLHDQDGYMSVAYGNLIALLIEGIKQLDTRLTQIEDYLMID